MKSVSSAAAVSDKNRVLTTFVSATYICLRSMPSRRGPILKLPPFSGSRRAAKIAGESNSGKQRKSIEESGENQGCRTQVSDDCVFLDTLIGHNGWPDNN